MFFVVFGNPVWPPCSACSFVVSGNSVLSLLLLHVVFVMTGNPAFSLGEWPSSPKGGSIFVVRCILIGLGEEGDHSCVNFGADPKSTLEIKKFHFGRGGGSPEKGLHTKPHKTDFMLCFSRSATKN